METNTLVIKKLINAPVHSVWEALTIPDQMKNWYFDIPSFVPTIGFEFSFTAGPEDKKYIHLCRITRVEPLQTLAYTWKYRDYAGESEVIFHLSAENNQTNLTLEHLKLETFPHTQNFSKESFEQGWTMLIEKNLNEYVSRDKEKR